MALRSYSNQGELWGPSPDLALAAGHPARAVDEIIERLNLDRCNGKYRHTPGEPAYDVRGTVKILIYAYMRGITSSREIARQCEENIAFQFLTRGQYPDFRTIARFRRKKRHLLRWVFKRTVVLARQMGIARLGLVALDSVKLPADASSGKKMTAAQLSNELGKLDDYLRKVEASDQKEDDQYGSNARGDELPPDIVGAQQRKEKLEKALEVLKERQSAAKHEPPKDVSIVDPEAPWVKKGGKFMRGYSGQVAADSEHQVIVGLKATAQGTDNDQLNPMLQEVEKTTGQAPVQLVADSGYYTDEAVLEASKSKTDCLVPDTETAAQLNNPKRGESAEAAYAVSQFVYDEANDEFTCPQGKKLAFISNHTKHGQATKIYRCADCIDCPFRAQCTNHASGRRSVEVRVDHAEVRKLRAKLKTESGKATYKKRKAIIEPIFGRWQHNWGIRRLRLRGLAGFSVELHLMAIAHNVTKLFRLQQNAMKAEATV
ncbi:MAG TPA: IS1182 family transposase [Acidobacteriota bacterium]|nr:IS1182 family transposase [Acidobacteriota bacterium]